MFVLNFKTFVHSWNNNYYFCLSPFLSKKEMFFSFTNVVFINAIILYIDCNYFVGRYDYFIKLLLFLF